MSNEKMIPVSAIDDLIALVRELASMEEVTYERKWMLVGVFLPMLEGLKNE